VFKLIKAIIFDFDGLIVDTETTWYECYREVLASLNLELSIEQFSKVIGTTDEVLYEYIRENLKNPVDRVEIESAVRDIFAGKMGEPTLREGVEDYLKEAKELGLKIGLASSSRREWVESYLKKLGIFHYYEVIKTGDEVAKVKPDPELYVKAVEELGIKPGEAVAFEDSLNGLIAAIGAGVHCVVVPNQVTAHLAFQGHSHRLSSMAEMSLKEVLQIVVGGCN
jgi:putative hydrolase of the HAD superfamily